MNIEYKVSKNAIYLRKQGDEKFATYSRPSYPIGEEYVMGLIAGTEIFSGEQVENIYEVCFDD